MKRVFCVLLATALLVSPAFSQEKYPIKLTSPKKVGQKYRTIAHSSKMDEATRSMDGKSSQQKKEATAHLEGEITVLEVGKRGLETKISCLVEKCWRKSGTNQADLFPKGTSIVVSEESGKKIFTTNGVAVSAEAKEALTLLLTLQTAEKDDDDVFGAKEPKAIGESWPINAGNFVENFKNLKIQMAARDVKGETKLVGVETVDGKKCLNISANLTAANVGVPISPKLKVRECTLACDMSGLFPMGESQRPFKETVTLKMMIKGDVDVDGRKIPTEMKMDETIERSFFD